ncbi:MAG: hypothetical protein V4492_08875 [Chlamydiota bacterium]
MMATNNHPIRSLHVLPAAMVLCLLLLSACSKQNEWAFDQIESQHKEHSSSKLTFVPQDPYNGIYVDWVQTSDILKVYLTVNSTPIPPHQGEAKEAKVVFFIAGNNHTFIGYRFEGGQKILLDETATHLLNATLERGQNVTIALTGYRSTIHPKEFPQQIAKLYPTPKWKQMIDSYLFF